MYKLTSDPFQLTSLKPHPDEEGVHIKVVSFHEATVKNISPTCCQVLRGVVTFITP